MNLKKSLVLVVIILIIDQISKIYIKTHFTYNESFEIFSWFEFVFIENSGAAWGTKLSDFLPISEETGKLILTIFRLFAVIGIGYWLFDTVKRKLPKTLAIAVALIFAGALGNIIDSVFYGLMFSESVYGGPIATLFSDQPYGSLFHGKVVDMLHFPFIENAVWPEWVPYFGGKTFSFFEPVFNIADMAISTGVGILLVFNKKAFAKPVSEQEEETQNL
tara:strand:+ start:21857 stop:22513 length:657 start_codon:yes stop_codon:yes gene_type:complete